MIEIIDMLMAVIMLIVLAAILLVTSPIWILPYAVYKLWWLK
jgi:hypothetical protein